MSRSIIKKMVGIGSSTLLSRFFAYFREILTMQFLGIGIISDAFFIALRVPNSLRKIFAEGALSSVLVPAFITADQDAGTDQVNRLLSVSFVMIELFIALIVMIICWQAPYIVYQMAPGATAIQLEKSVIFLKILAPFILFLSSSAILSAALQATHRFLLPGLAPAILNIFYVICLLGALHGNWSPETLCISWIIAAIINCFIHLYACLHYKFHAAMPNKSSWIRFGKVILQLLPCIVSVGIGEINFWIDSAFASYLQSGTISLLRCSYQLINIPLGVIATSLSIILLPQFSKIGRSKDELGVYLADAIMFVTWMMLPIIMVMAYSSQQIFETMFLSSKFTMEHVLQASMNMNAYLAGLLFFALEKIVLNAFYALQATGIATCVAVATIIMNFFMNRFFMTLYGGTGLALATSISAGVRILMLLFILAYYFKIDLKLTSITKMIGRYLVQLGLCGTGFYIAAQTITRWIEQIHDRWLCSIFNINLSFDAYFFLHSFGFWLWFGPLIGIFFLVIYMTRKICKISFSYLE